MICTSWNIIIHTSILLSLLPPPPQPDGDPGDVIVILQEEDHALFKRAGLDLMMEKTLSLNEALCGCEFAIKHLDGQQLMVKTRPGEVISPGE